MRRATHHRILITATALVAALALAVASVALAAPAGQRSASVLASSQARTLALGTITAFSPASITVGSGPFSLLMDLSPEASSAGAWTAQWNGPSGVFPLTLEATGTASAAVSVPAGAVSDPGPVIVSISDGITAWSGSYAVEATVTAPHIDSISPVSSAAGNAAFTLRVNGSDFATGASPARVLWNGSALVAATPTGPVNPTAVLYATVPASALLQPGAATVKVVNPAPGGGMESNGVLFAITGPVLTSISPATGPSSAASVTFVLTGTDLNLAGAPRVVQLRGTGSNSATVITATGVVYEPPTLPGGQGRIVGLLNLANSTGTPVPVPAPPGKYDVRLMFANDGAKSVTLPGAFEVTGPSMTGVTPASATNGASSLALTIAGTGLNTLTSPKVTLKGPGASGTTVVTASGVSSPAPGTTMTCRIDLTSPSVAPAGLYDVTITSASGKTLTRPQSFTISNAAPTITAVTPNLAWSGSVKPTTLTITGSGFVPGSAGSRVRIGGRVVTTTTFVSAGKLTVPLGPVDVAAPGSLPVTVENPAPGGGTSQGASLTIGIDTSAPSSAISGADDSWHNKPVTLTVTATDQQSGVQRTQWTRNGSAAAILSGTSITVPAPSDGSGDGYQRIAVWSTDWCDHVENPPVSATVRIDTIGPKTYAWAPSSVKRKAKVKLKFRADDLTPTTSVTLKIKKANGTVARAYKMRQRTSYRQYTLTVRPKLPKGTYRLFVYATDLAGNKQSRLGTDAFRVK